jgi:ankyrin repeat protein
MIGKQFQISLAVTATLCLGTAVCLAQAGPQEFFDAIRANDLAALRKLASGGTGRVDAADTRRNAPLHYAAMFGSVESIRVLLEAGAKVDARNGVEATPLILAAGDGEKVKLLVEAGADVNAVSKLGRTPLITAAARIGSAPAVALLLARGARTAPADMIGYDALAAAANSANTPVARLLIEKGAGVDVPDKEGATALLYAASNNDLELTKLLLTHKARVNVASTAAHKVRHGEIALNHLTALMLAAPFGTPELIGELLKAGAAVNARDIRQMTPLMLAVASENQDVRVVRMLLGAGADVNARDGEGESVLDWARKFGSPEVISELEKAGAKAGKAPVAAPVRPADKAPLAARAAIDGALKLLAASSTGFFKESGCLGCHNQPVGARAWAAARAAGIDAAASLREDHLNGITASRPMAEPATAQLIPLGGDIDPLLHILSGSADIAAPATLFSDVVVFALAARQQENGSWALGGVSRAPMEESNITRTAMGIRALKVYGWPARKAEFDERIARARGWLLQARPRTSYEMADLLTGLYWSGASAEDVARAGKALAATQRDDGGWSQNPNLASDAYATGLALAALHQTGQARPGDPVYQGGVAYLLRNQLEDGSWYVRSRAPKFQPYFQSGFPHNHDQWISAAATAYAVMGLAPAAAVERASRD